MFSWSLLKDLHGFHIPTTTLLTQLFRTEQHLGPIHYWMVGDSSLTNWASVAGMGLLSVSGTITYDIKTNPTCREIKRDPVGSRECGWNAGLSRNVDPVGARVVVRVVRPGDERHRHQVQCPDSLLQGLWRQSQFHEKRWGYFNKYTYIVILCEDEKKNLRRIN